MIKPNFRHIINGKRFATALDQDYNRGEVLMVGFIDVDDFY